MQSFASADVTGGGGVTREEFISYDVLEAESALAGEPLAFAPAAQVLSVGPLGVDVALRPGAGTARPVARLKPRRRAAFSQYRPVFIHRTKAVEKKLRVLT